MVKTDIEKAQKIVSINNSSNLVSNTPYHENSFIYRTTNEQIDKYQSYLKNRENILSMVILTMRSLMIYMILFIQC